MHFTEKVNTETTTQKEDSKYRNKQMEESSRYWK